MSSHEGSPAKNVVYTALFGRYEKLTEQPTALNSEADFICFTDDPELASATWDVRLIPRQPHFDTVRNARFLKILGHDQLDDYSATMWIDNRVLLVRDPEDFFSLWLGEHEMAVPRHFTRTSLRAEFRAVLAHNFDEPYRVRGLLTLMTAAAPDVLNDQPYWSAILLRRKTAPVRETMRVWFDLLLLYSRRDQLSLNYSLHLAPCDVSPQEVDPSHSSWIRWLDDGAAERNTTHRSEGGRRYPLRAYVLDVLRRSKNFRRLDRHLRGIQ